MSPIRFGPSGSVLQVRAKQDMRQGGALDRLLQLVRLPLIDNLYLQV